MTGRLAASLGLIEQGASRQHGKWLTSAARIGLIAAFAALPSGIVHVQANTAAPAPTPAAAPTTAAIEVKAARLCLEALAPIEMPSRVTWQRWGQIPRAFVGCSDDHTLSLAQQRTIQAAAACGPVFTIDTDHSPFLSDPHALADALIAAAGQFIAISAQGDPAQDQSISETRHKS